ncbi:hypothetical protein MUK42_16901 [Musa troglodytarum]|uniref:Uncharacterized protein n=1 Tax=Musa troglodytarum TaxID=320322 RepID=A0A9E7IAU8_9LILI|nr:hypothetical protein MUK42_16901 [Musa troglodytarum]
MGKDLQGIPEFGHLILHTGYQRGKLIHLKFCRPSSELEVKLATPNTSNNGKTQDVILVSKQCTSRVQLERDRDR